jgi:PAS domain S-box-containing protein
VATWVLKRLGQGSGVVEGDQILRQVIDSNPQMVFLKDWHGRFVLANLATAQTYGTTPAELVGKCDADFNPDAEQVAAFIEADRRVMTSLNNLNISAEPVIDASTGVIRWFDTVKVPMVSSDGHSRMVLGISTDITARRHAEEELRRTGDELRGWFAASPLATCSLTLDSKVLSWNRAAEQLFGWTADELIGQQLPVVPKEREAEARDLHVRVVAGDEFTNFETQRRRKDGTLVDVSISTAALHDKAGEPCGLAAVYADISERKALELQLRQSQRMEAIGQLAGGVAHDFNNILTVIQAAAEFLQSDLSEDDARRKDAEVIAAAANRASALTRQLLAFSRQQVLQLSVLNVNDVIVNLEPMLRRLVTMKVVVELQLAADLATIRADATQLDQVLINLLVNARDAMPNGGKVVIATEFVAAPAAERETGQPGTGHVVISVRDSGHGMDEETQSRIFEPFFTTKGVGLGTGLGLATVYGIVQQLGGEVTVESQPGAGANFRIVLPTFTGGGATNPAPLTAGPKPTRAATILLVEDEAAVRSVVERILTRRGYRVIDAVNGAEALTLARNPEPIDMVLSDMMMPEMNGLELRRKLAEQGFLGPVVLMSGYPAEVIAQEAVGEFTGPILQKPFSVESLVEVVEAALGQREGPLVQVRTGLQS